MGIAIRTKEYLALNISSIIWKLLINDTPTIEDIELIDYSLIKSIDIMKSCDEESFNCSFYENYNTISSDDRMIELIPNGSNVDVTYENRLDYCDKIIQVSLFI